MSDRERDSLSPDASRRRNRSPDTRSRSRSPRRPVRVKSKRVIIANCPYDVSWQKLKEVFREKVGYTGYLDMIETNGKQTGMGIMEFRTYEGAEKAIETMHRYPIGDRKLVVREETPRDQERIAQLKSNVDPAQTHAQMNNLLPAFLAQSGIEGPATDSVYVSNLEFSVPWQKIKDVFKLAGHVLNVELKTDKDGKSRGFAIVKFEHPFEAAQAISMFNGQIFFDRPMRVKFDREAPAARSGPGGILTGGAGGRTGGAGAILGGMGNAPNFNSRNGSAANRGRLPEGLKSMGSGFGAGGSALRNMQDFATMPGGNVSGSMLGGAGNMSMSGGGAANNAALAGLQQLLSAAAAGGMSQDQIIAAAAAMGQGMQLLNSNTGSGDTGLSGGRGGSGVLGNMGNGRMSGGSTVVVRNLPFSYTWQDLKRSFSEAGDVRSAEIKTDNNRKSKGFGFVHFYRADDAMRAIDILNGARFDGRTIRVELDGQP